MSINVINYLNLCADIGITVWLFAVDASFVIITGTEHPVNW